jgi:UDP-N-acetylmuramoyl-L-alanyl-D-glutamate--2,6-diaminopimelate ligase
VGSELAASLPRVVTYGITRRPTCARSRFSRRSRGLAFQIDTPRPLSMRSPLVGRPNVYNILVWSRRRRSAFRTHHRERHRASGWRAGPVSGVSGTTDDVRVVVDYAHTDDALKNLLETARPLATAGSSRCSAAAAIAIAPSGR